MHSTTESLHSIVFQASNDTRVATVFQRLILAKAPLNQILHMKAFHSQPLWKKIWSVSAFLANNNGNNFSSVFFSQKLSRKKRLPFFHSFRSYVCQGCQMVYFQNKNPNLGKFWN
jgi:hypothetical protein